MCIFHACSLFRVRAVNVTCPIVSVRQPEDVIPALCARRCLTVNGRQRFMKLWRWQIEALVKHPDAGGCRNNSWLTAMPRIGPGLAVYTAVSGLDRGSAGRAPSVTTPGHGSVPLAKKTNLQRKNLPRLSSDSRTRRWALISAEAEGKHCACLRRLYIVLSHRWRKVFIFTSNRLGEPAAAVISFSSVPWLRFYNWEIKMKETAVGVKGLPRLVQD